MLYSTTQKGVIYLKRNAIQELIKWKSSEERKPLVMRGARQVGKTWLMKEFGQNYYESYVYFNFDEEDELKSIFEANKNPHRIIELLSMIAGLKILPEKTLILFDEIFLRGKFLDRRFPLSETNFKTLIFGRFFFAF